MFKELNNKECVKLLRKQNKYLRAYIDQSMSKQTLSHTVGLLQRNHHKNAQIS